MGSIWALKLGSDRLESLLCRMTLLGGVDLVDGLIVAVLKSWSMSIILLRFSLFSSRKSSSLFEMSFLLLLEVQRSWWTLVLELELFTSIIFLHQRRGKWFSSLRTAPSRLCGIGFSLIRFRSCIDISICPRLSVGWGWLGFILQGWSFVVILGRHFCSCCSSNYITSLRAIQ